MRRAGLWPPRRRWKPPNRICSPPRASSRAAQAKREHDQVLFDYSKITAPFAGMVTQRFANLGTLVQAGTSSSTQAMPLVRLSQDDIFRLVIPVPESYVRYIHIGDPVSVMVPSLNRTFPGRWPASRWTSKKTRAPCTPKWMC